MDRTPDSGSGGRGFESRPDYQPMTASELRKIGEFLYGKRWQTTLARRIKVDARTVRRWLAGKRKIRPQVAEHIRSLRPQ